MKTLKPKHILLTLSLLLFAHSYYLTAKWFETNKLQSPIVVELRLPWTERYVSPVPKGRSAPVINNIEQDIKKVTPTPTPKKKTQGFDLVRDVQAAETDQVTDQEIIEYIRSKDWDDDIAVALAKSENFWNLTKSFNCSRTGGLNKNGTRDHGLWQINDIHINSGAISLENANNCFKATDFAYGLYKGRGNNFSAWSAFNNGSYLNHL